MRLFPLALAALSLAACNKAPEQVTVTDAVVQLPAVPGRPGAAYFTLRGGSADARLVSVKVEGAERTELHETAMEGNVMRMGPLRDPAVPAGAEVTFAPGGKHVMLFGIDPALQPGGKARITLELEPGGALVTQADVRAFGGEGHAAH